MASTLAPTARPTASTPTHLNFLDGLRGVAALYVVLHHLWLQIWPIDQNVWPAGADWFTTGWLVYGRFAVDVFIVLSGFCLALPVVRGDGTLRGGSKTFFLKRARRILPPYYAAVLLSLALIATLIGQKTGTHWDISVGVDKWGLLAHALLLQDLLTYRLQGQVNHVLWSVAVEWHIYFLFPFIVAGMQRFGALKATLACSVLAYTANACIMHTLYNGLTAYYLALFAFGILGASIAFSPASAERWRQTRWDVVAVAITSVVVTGALFLGWETMQRHVVLVDSLVGVATTALLIHIAGRGSGRISRFLSWQPFVFLGTIGYSLYLIHAPLLQLVHQYLVMPLHLSQRLSFIALICGLPLIVLASYLFFWCCERPFLSRLKRIN